MSDDKKMPPGTGVKAALPSSAMCNPDTLEGIEVEAGEVLAVSLEETTQLCLLRDGKLVPISSLPAGAWKFTLEKLAVSPEQLHAMAESAEVPDGSPRPSNKAYPLMIDGDLQA